MTNQRLKLGALNTATYRLITLSLTLLCLSSAPLSVYAEPSEAQWKAFNLAALKHYIIPGYAKLDTTSSQLTESITKLCQDVSQSNLNQARSDFHLAMDSWQSIQNINFGPVEIAMRSHSMQFWPDKKNHIGKQLGTLLGSQNTQMLEDENFEKASISVKGLPALERLLFSDKALAQLGENTFRCQVLTRISQNVSKISRSLHQEWIESMLPQFKDAKQLDGYFEDDIDAATAVLKTLVEPLEIIRDLKLKRPLGSQFGKEKFKRLESWRSERSLKNIGLNIESLEKLYAGNTGNSYSGLAKMLDAKTQEKINLQLAAVKKAHSSIPSPLESSITTQQGHAKTETLYHALGSLHQSLELAVSGLGIHLGFNSRDGD